jgi:hypothetical protein
MVLLHKCTADVIFVKWYCCSAGMKDRRHGPITNSTQIAGALDTSVIAGLPRCAHGDTSVPMHIVADMRIAAAENILAKKCSIFCHNIDRLK